MEHGLMSFLRDPWLARPLAFLLSAAVYWVPATTALAQHLADPISDAAAHGQNAGQAFVPSPDIATADSQGNITLYPNGGAPQTIPAGELFPGATGDFSAYTSTYGNDAAMQTLGTDTQAILETQQSYPGEAYRTIIDSRLLSIPDMRSDPVWAQTDDTLNNLAMLAPEFSDCTATTTTVPGSITTRVPDYRTCERLYQAPQFCTLSHQIDVDQYLVTLRAGVYFPHDAVLVADFKTGSVTLDPSGSDPGAVPYGDITPTLNYDAICGSGAPYTYQTLGTWDWPFAGPYDASFTWNVLQEPSCANGFIARIKLTDVGGWAWYYSGIQQQVRLWRKASDTWQWSSPQCPGLLQAVQDGFCTGTLQCTVNNRDCADVNGVTLCGTQLEPPPAPVQGIPNGCLQAEVQANCGFNQGGLQCYTDASGNLQCPQNTGDNPNSCTQYETNPNCGFISSRCLQGAQGASGSCYVYEETWDCGVTTTVPTERTGTTYDCVGPIRCMGNDCVTQPAEQNPDFARAVAALNTAQFMSMDSSCAQASQGGGHYDVNTCTVFAGEAYQCKKAVGGVVDCCKTPDGVSLAEYINLIYKLNDVGAFDTAADWLSASPLRGAWETLRDPVVNSWSSVKDWFASAWNNLSGSTTAAASEQAASLSLEQFKQQMMQAAYDWVNQLFGTDAANALFTDAGGSVVLNESVGAALQWIATAYMIYTIVILVINLIWECEEREFELGAKRELKLCTHVGSYCASELLGSCVEKRESYCCFSSPLSRIIQEQVRPQLAMTWGSAKSPSCNGLSLDQIGQVDWSTVNLDEWIGILNLAGKLPTAANLNLDRVTGSGNFLNVDGNRPDAQTRAVQRIDGLDTTGVRIEAGQQLR